MGKLLLGLDIGSSSVKACLVDSDTGKSIISAQSPAEEMPMVAVQPGWAEQDPDLWWDHTVQSIKICLQNAKVKAEDITAIGISYQMHGLVIVGKDHKPLRSSIIWCDSRAVSIGDNACKSLGQDYCLEHFLNSPGNFTASKLRWVKENEPAVFDKIYKAMLPGDYIALRLSGDIVTTDTGLSEGIFWDFTTKTVSEKLLKTYEIGKEVIAPLKPVFSVQGELRKDAAETLGLKPGIRIAYRAGDQPNNAFSLNVLNPGETAATAGTSGVIYSVTEKNAFDRKSRVNTFIHVNNKPEAISNGVLLCINGTGIMNSWLRKNMRATGSVYDYVQMNDLAKDSSIGSDGLIILPFGNGAERVLENKSINASFHGLDFNRHGQSQIFRAAQEGIVFALRYGLDVLQSMGLKTTVIRAGHANMFLSPLFREAFVNTIGAPLQLFDTNGAVGAAVGAGVGAGVFSSFKEAFKGLTLIKEESPDKNKQQEYQGAYAKWKAVLETQLQK
jgi:xylulokinase